MQVQVAWIKPAAWGVIVGAVGTMIIGFSWFEWTLRSTAEQMALERANAAVVYTSPPPALRDSCRQPDAVVKLVAFQKLESWKQPQFIEEGGWATPRGSKTPNSSVASACAEELAKTKN